MSLSDRKPMRACGKAFDSAEAAGRYKPVLEGRREVVAGCPCGKFHTQAVTTNGPRLAERPIGQASANGPTPKVRKLVLKRDGYACVCCGKSILGQRYSLAHRVRASQGGQAVPENLVTLLGWGGEQCHGRVDLYKDPEDGPWNGQADGDGGKGYRLPSGADPAMEPVLIIGEDGDGELWWLTPHGTYAPKPPERRAA